MGDYLWPWTECLSTRSIFFTVLVTLDAFWFVDFSFLSLLSQEVVKAALCTYVCASRLYTTLISAPTLWGLWQFSCVIVQDGRSLSKQYYFPHFWKQVMLACLPFDLTCHNIAAHWFSKWWSKTTFFLRKYKWNPLKSHCTTVDLSCHKKGPLIPRGGTGKLFVRGKHECKLSMRKPRQSSKSNSALCRTL